MLQFSFSNPNVIPDTVRKRKPETKTEQQQRKQRPPSGTMVITPSENTSIESFVQELIQSDYILVDAVTQKRPHPKRQNQHYYIARFVFSRKEHAKETSDFVSVRHQVQTELLNISNDAFWRIRAFKNPFFQDGGLVQGFNTLSFNFEARVPRFDSRGQAVLARKKDSQGRKIGDPVSLEAQHELHICDGSVLLS